MCVCVFDCVSNYLSKKERECVCVCVCVCVSVSPYLAHDGGHDPLIEGGGAFFLHHEERGLEDIAVSVVVMCVCMCVCTRYERETTCGWDGYSCAIN